MSTPFNPEEIEKHGWRQGAVLARGLVDVARTHAPDGVNVADDDWIIVTSHDCDVVNNSLQKEPVVEVLLAKVLTSKAPDKQQVWGRNPRTIQFETKSSGAGAIFLAANVHERWSLPRSVFESEAPALFLGDKERRLIAEWLAKRYIRAAFPTAFDRRWRDNLRGWSSLLEAHSAWIEGIYLRLNTVKELSTDVPYQVDVLAAASVAIANHSEWNLKRPKIVADIEKFWRQFSPHIELIDVDVRLTNDITLADIASYQRFDVDWVSFADDSPATPLVVQLST